MVGSRRLLPRNCFPSSFLEQPEELIGFRDWNLQSLFGLLARLAFSNEPLVALVWHSVSILLPLIMSHPLDGCWAKIKRANVHLEFLQERVDALVVEEGLYGVSNYPDIETGEIIVYGETIGPLPVHEWGAIIGDVVHNLRSALDHLVWRLTINEGSTPPVVIPRSRKDPDFRWRNVSFPIYVEPYPVDHLGNLIPWATSKEPGSLWGIEPRLRADFQALQPFIHGQNASKESLAILDELWNIDKHRHLHLTLFLVGLEDVVSKSKDFKFKVTQKKAPGPFKGRAEIGRAKQVGRRLTQMSYVYMHSKVSYSIAFEQGPPAYGARVIEVLERLHDTVAAILVQFEPEFT